MRYYKYVQRYNGKHEKCKIHIFKHVISRRNTLSEMIISLLRLMAFLVHAEEKITDHEDTG